MKSISATYFFSINLKGFFQMFSVFSGIFLNIHRSNLCSPIFKISSGNLLKNHLYAIFYVATFNLMLETFFLNKEKFVLIYYIHIYSRNPTLSQYANNLKKVQYEKLHFFPQMLKLTFFDFFFKWRSSAKGHSV